MSSNKGLTPNVRKAMLAEEFGDGDGEVAEVEIAPQPEVHPPAPEVITPVVVAPAPAPVDMVALIQALVAGISQANIGAADAIREALGQATTMAREPIPENKIDPGRSVYSHPDGDQAHPRTELRCPMFLGIYDDEGMVKPAFEIYQDTCTELERVALNALTPGVYPQIARHDGSTATWRVQEKKDGNDVPLRLVIAVPQTWLSQAEFHQMPGMLQALHAMLTQKQAQTQAA